MADAAPPPLSVSLRISADGHTVHVTLAGELDVRTTALLRRQVDEALSRASTDVVVDGSGLQFVDVDGLNVLAAIGRRVTRDGGVLRLQGASPLLARMLRETGLDEVVVVER